MLDNITNQLSKFRAKNWVELTDDRNGIYATDKEIKFKSSMLNSSLLITKIYIFVKGTISVANTATPDTDANNTNWKVIFKKCSPFEKGITEINNTQVDNA